MFGFGVRDFLVRGSGFLGFRFAVSCLAFRSFWFSRFRVFAVRGFPFGGSGFGVSRLGLLVWLSRFPLRVLGVSVRVFEVRGCGFCVLRFLVSGSWFRCSGFWRFGVFEVRGLGIGVLRFVVLGWGFRVSGLGVSRFRGWGFGVRGFSSGFRFRVSTCWVSWFGVAVSGSGFRF